MTSLEFRHSDAEKEVAQPVQSAAERVIEAIQQDLVFARIRPRERLVEADLAQRFDVARYVIRQALDELEHRGVVRRERNKGAVVHDFSLLEVESICEMRVLLQSHAMKTVELPGEPAWVERLAQSQQAHAAAVKRRDVPDVYRLNKEFHEIQFETVSNPYLVEQIRYFTWLLDVVRSYRLHGPALNPKAPKEHAAMVEAIRAGDRERLVELSVNHVPPANEVFYRIRRWSGSEQD